MSAQQMLQTLIDRDEKIAVAELHALYGSLPAIDGEFMLGDWRGGCFNTDHRGEKMLAKLGWGGKRFTALNDVNPIMSLDANDKLQVNEVMGTAVTVVAQDAISWAMAACRRGRRVAAPPPLRASPCHCERSEATPSSRQRNSGDCFMPRFARS